jgi:hypothetical protein
MLCATSSATLGIAVRVDFIARQVPSQARNVTHDRPVTLLCHSHLSIQPLRRSRVILVLHTATRSPYTHAYTRRVTALDT